MDRIRITGMQFYGYHGVMPQEQSLGQRFIVHVVMSLDLAPAGESDDLKKSINYADVYSRVKRIVEGEPVRLLESLAEHIAKDLLDSFALLESVDIQVDKPSAPIPGIFDSVSIEITRHRGQ